MRSLFGLKALTRIFKAMDVAGDCNVECDDFRWGLMDFGVQVTKEEASELLSNFSKVDDKVNYGLFLDSFKVSNCLVLRNLILIFCIDCLQ